MEDMSSLSAVVATSGLSELGEINFSTNESR